MHALYDLKDMLCKQLEDYGKKGEMSAAILERVDMLAHALKNLDRIIENMEEKDGDYSGAVRMSANRPYDDGHSMARGRNAKRDSMGRYASDGSTMEHLREMMEDAPDERTRQELQRVISRLESR